jgi:hypothetical protein
MFYSSKHRKINITGLFSKELELLQIRAQPDLGQLYQIRIAVKPAQSRTSRDNVLSV